jgi:protein TonB
MRGDAHLVESYPVQMLRWAVAAVFVTGVHIGGGGLALLHWKSEEVPERSAGSVAIELAPVAVAPSVDATDLAHGPLTEEAAPTAQATNEPVEKAKEGNELPMAEPSPLAPEPEVALPISKPEQDKKSGEHSQQPLEAQPSPEQAASVPLATSPPEVVTATGATAAAPAPGTSAIPAPIQASWQKALMSHLNRFKRYPSSARARGIQGIVQIRFTIDQEGRLMASHVAQSSGSPVLDAEALATLRRANPLPAPPVGVADATFYLLLPIHFRIR